jgi:hypothetical protein
MFMRIVRPQVKADKVEEAAQRWQDFVGSRAKQNPKFKSGYMAASIDRSSVVAVTLWDELPDEAATKQFQGEIAAHLQDLLTGPPTTDEYEIIAQI